MKEINQRLIFVQSGNEKGLQWTKLLVLTIDVLD